MKVVTGTTTTSTTVAPTTTIANTTTTSTSPSTTSSVVVGDRTAPVVTLGRSTGSSGVATFTVIGNEPIRCSTLSGSEGIDFVFERISRINSIVQTTKGTADYLPTEWITAESI